MTRFDIFIRKKILDTLSLNYLELTPIQESMIQSMIQETYENNQLLSLSIEDRIAYVANQYRKRIAALS